MRNTKTESTSGVKFTYYKTIPVNIREYQHTDHTKYRVNTKALLLYGLYRNTVYDAYRDNAELAKDIKVFRRVYEEPENSVYKTDPLYQDPLYHYSVYACTDAMKEWSDPKLNMQAYLATGVNNGERETLGFIHFYEATVGDKSVVYIAQAGVLERGKSIGRRLMECVLKHYPEDTTFYVLTRVFNHQAKTLYGERFNFEPIPLEEIKALGYDERYCGFVHTTTDEELVNIVPNQKISGKG